MDLGIAGKWALVCGASKGLGLGCAQALAGEGVNVPMLWLNNGRGNNDRSPNLSNLRCRVHSDAGRAGAGLLWRGLPPPGV